MTKTIKYIGFSIKLEPLGTIKKEKVLFRNKLYKNKGQRERKRERERERERGGERERERER